MILDLWEKLWEITGVLHGNGIWLFGVSSWLFGITDRSIASFSDGYLSALDLTQLFTAATFFAAWLFLKPTYRVAVSTQQKADS